ncbi:MAG TPA: MBL fold metallo-hydrolase RNA specificity domain-containing protein [Dehalococcoidia bacterium]|nr:MBL fold metallo-hydrolase RNA specificity domain-containing protein [Dehalococcoidia bacterium]
MPRLTLLGGVGEVGGNKVMLEEDGSVLFLDFGTSYSRRGRYYEEFLKPRPGFGILDLLEMGLLPPLEGLYRPDLHPRPDDPDSLWDAYRHRRDYRDLRDVQVVGVLCSHGHLDHAGYISVLREEVAVVSTLLSALVMKAVQDCAPSDIEGEVVYAVPRLPKKDLGVLEAGDYNKVAARQRRFCVFGPTPAPEADAFWRETPGSRPLESRPFQLAPQVLHLGPFAVRCFPVDHSIPGAAGFLIETGGLAIGYTGDLRFHGSRADHSQAFVDALAQAASRQPLVLLCEGTRAGDDDHGPVSEDQVAQRALEFMRDARGLIIADFGPRNLERLSIFHRLARMIGRRLVIMAKDAYLLDAARLADPSLPQIGPELDVLVYLQPKGTYYRWERSIYERYRSCLITPDEVGRRQDELVLCFSYYDLKDLPSIRPRPGSLYLYSSHEAFDEEVQMDFRRLRNWLDHFQMRYVGLPREELQWRVPEEEMGLHASGHAPARELLEMVRRVQPALVVPLHTRNPQWFQERLADSGIAVHLPREGQQEELEALLSP